MALNVCMHKSVHKINVQNISQINHDSVNLVIHFLGAFTWPVFNWKEMFLVHFGRSLHFSFWKWVPKCKIKISCIRGILCTSRMDFYDMSRCCSVLLNIGLVVEWDRAVWSFFKILLWGSMKKMQCQCKRANCI